MKAIFAVLFISLAAIASAGTVSLTGTCPSAIANGTASFMLNNTGNESATNLIVTLHFIGNATSNRSTQLNSIGPAQSVNIPLPVAGHGGTGTFGSYFLVVYQQDSSVFSAIFPCLIDIGNGTTSQILAQSSVARTSKNSSKVDLSMINGGYGTINASVDLVLPLGLSTRGNTNTHVDVKSTSKSTISFPVSYPEGSGIYTGAVITSYSIAGVDYATLSVVNIDTSPSSSGIAPGTLLGYAVGVVVVLFLLLIGRSLLVRRRKVSASS
ncbi:MAG: hypothetical protein KGH69_03655 [Candidatus Micrarchaeota archaeon]|nr:hypothetical protein [Candidatus Micrarchaeota archaeon]